MPLLDKSIPVHLAPNLLKLNVSCPKWHCKCNNNLPFTFPNYSNS